MGGGGKPRLTKNCIEIFKQLWWPSALLAFNTWASKGVYFWSAFDRQLTNLLTTLNKSNLCIKNSMGLAVRVNYS